MCAGGAEKRNGMAWLSPARMGRNQDPEAPPALATKQRKPLQRSPLWRNRRQFKSPAWPERLERIQRFLKSPNRKKD